MRLHPWEVLHLVWTSEDLQTEREGIKKSKVVSNLTFTTLLEICPEVLMSPLPLSSRQTTLLKLWTLPIILSVGFVLIYSKYIFICLLECFIIFL